MQINTSRNIIISLISCLVLNFISYSPYGILPHYTAIISSFVVFFTIYPLIFNKELINLYITPFITMNWIFFQSPFLLKNKTYYFPRKILPEYIDEIAIYTCLSIFLIYIGYFFILKNVSPLTSKNFKFKNSTIRKLVYLFVSLNILLSLGNVFAKELTGSLSNLIQLLFYSPLIALALYGMYLIRTKTFPTISFFHIFTIFFLLLELLIRVSSTMFVSISLLFSGVILMYFLEKKKLPIIFLTIILLTLYPIYKTRKYYRDKAKVSMNVSGIEKGQVILDDILSSEGQTGFNDYSYKRRKRDSKSNRFENLSFISQVVYYHEKRKWPFLEGETFYWHPLTPIPRIVYPNKPKNILATEIATKYQLRGVGSTAAINFPMLVEAYINFGFVGILVLSLCFGVLFKFFILKFGLGLGDINLLIIINSIKQLIHTEGNITLVFGALIQVFLFWFILLKVLKISNRTTSL